MKKIHLWLTYVAHKRLFSLFPHFPPQSQPTKFTTSKLIFFIITRICIYWYRKSSINPPPGAYFYQTHLVGGGGLFNLAKTMVLVLHKELKYILEKLKCKKMEVMQPRIKNKYELIVGG